MSNILPGLTNEKASQIVIAMSMMTGPGAENRIEFVAELRKRALEKTLDKEIIVTRRVATDFRNGIMAGIQEKGRTDMEAALLLEVASTLGISSWIKLPKTEEAKDEFDPPSDIPFDGAPA